MPVYGTQASRFNDDSVTAQYQRPIACRQRYGLNLKSGKLAAVNVKNFPAPIMSSYRQRARYLAEIADTLARLSQARCANKSTNRA